MYIIYDTCCMYQMRHVDLLHILVCVKNSIILYILFIHRRLTSCDVRLICATILIWYESDCCYFARNKFLLSMIVPARTRGRTHCVGRTGWYKYRVACSNKWFFMVKHKLRLGTGTRSRQWIAISQAEVMGEEPTNDLCKNTCKL